MSADRDESFWFSDHPDEEDADEHTKGMWQPFVQVPGCCFPLPIWFSTEAECKSWIIDTIPAGTSYDD